MSYIEVGEWAPVPGFYDCIPDSIWSKGAHWHPENHDASHRMGRPPKSKPLERHCIERGCSYLERRTVR